MGKHDLQDLVIGLAQRLRRETEIIEFGNDHDLWELDLYFRGGTNEYAHDFLYYSLYDGVYERGDKADVRVGEVADAAVAFLKPFQNWATWAFENKLSEIFVLARRAAGGAKRHLYSGGNLAPDGVPGDPLLPF